ncbi:MAG TPA: polymer-forming cytoskeletal protein [Parvibaculum sp.]
MSSDPVESFPGASSSGSFKDAPKRMQVASVRVMRAGSEDIVVGENSSLEGTFETQGSMFVDGSMTKADLKTSLLSIGTSGSVEGSATVSRAEIAGSFDGRLTVTGEVILRSTSHVTGEIQCGKLITHRGATIRAQVSVVDDESEAGDGGDEARPSIFLRRKPFGRSFLRRAAPFAYGIFFTLGMIGIISLLIRS